ncbi:MAG: putative metal-dependent hydrolase [Neolewinella sp.]|jgi:predicted metal-dependent hydrolase
MARRPKKIHEQRETLHFGNLKVPVRVITESGRYNTRASITSKAMIIRLPRQLTESDRTSQLRNMLQWAKELHADKPETFAHFHTVRLANQYRFSIREQAYAISVDQHELRSHRIVKTGADQLQILLNPDDARVSGGKILPKLLAKYFGGIYLPDVARRVHELNKAHFRRPINNVKLSDTYTRWGSCSHKGNINLATRLLLAPDEVLDAVIIHELAHLVEQNHSSRFWAQVERALPNYLEFDEWLKEHGKSLLFQPEAIDMV